MKGAFIGGDLSQGGARKRAVLCYLLEAQIDTWRFGWMEADQGAKMIPVSGVSIHADASC